MGAHSRVFLTGRSSHRIVYVGQTVSSIQVLGAVSMEKPRRYIIAPSWQTTKASIPWRNCGSSVIAEPGKVLSTFDVPCRRKIDSGTFGYCKRCSLAVLQVRTRAPYKRRNFYKGNQRGATRRINFCSASVLGSWLLLGGSEQGTSC